MIYLGTDLVEIERVELAVRRHPALWERLLTPREIAYCQGKGNPIQALAGRFAAKEAVLKCLGIGLRSCSWHDLEVLPDALGGPQVSFQQALRRVLQEKEINMVKVSITHSRHYAMAVAIGECLPKCD